MANGLKYWNKGAPLVDFGAGSLKYWSDGEPVTSGNGGGGSTPTNDANVTISTTLSAAGQVKIQGSAGLTISTVISAAGEEPSATPRRRNSLIVAT